MSSDQAATLSGTPPSIIAPSTRSVPSSMAVPLGMWAKLSRAASLCRWKMLRVWKAKPRTTSCQVSPSGTTISSMIRSSTQRSSSSLLATYA